MSRSTPRGLGSPFSIVTLACAIAAALTLPCVPAQQPEQGIFCCDSVPVHHLNYGEYTNGTAIGPTGTDTDVFSFEGAANDVVRIVLRGHTNGLDPRLRLFGPGATGLLHDGSCSAPFNARCTNEHVTAPLPVSGTYTVIASDQGSNSTGSYRLEIDCLWPIQAAPPLSYGSSKAETFGVSTDVDFFTFMASSSTFFDLFLTTTTNGLDLMVDIVDAAGTVVANGSCSAPFNATCQVAFNFVPGMVTLPGLHYIRVKEWGADGTGNYNLSLQCLTPPCPGNPLVPCGGGTGALAVSGMEPSVLSSNGGYAARLLGAGFCSGSPATTVTIGGVPMPDTFVAAPGELHFTVPSLPVGVHDLTVTTALATLTLPGFVDVRDAALVADNLFPLGGHGEIALRSTAASGTPVIVLADLAPGTTSLGTFGQTQLDLLSPTLIALADASGIFGPSITCVVTGSSGSWFFRPPVPNDPALSGLMFYSQAFVIDSNAANGLFSATNLATVSF